MSKLLLFMLMISMSVLGSNAMTEARNLTNSKVLSAGYGSDGTQKLFAITSNKAFLFVKQGRSFNKFFEKTFKGSETVLFNSAGLTDIDNNGHLDFWYATKNNGKKTLYVINTKPAQGKYSTYLVALKSDNKILKSANLKANSAFHKWMESKVRNLNENLTVIVDTQKKPPLQLVESSATKTAEGLVDGKILKAGFYQNQNGSKFLYAITDREAYLFTNSGSSYSKFFNKKLKKGYRPLLADVNVYDISRNGYGDFFYVLANNSNDKILSVVNTKPKEGKFSFYLLMARGNGSLNKSANLKENSVYHNWMKKRLGSETTVVTTPVVDTPRLSGDYIYLCDMTTNGKGGYKVGGTYCGASINDLNGYEIVFQKVYGNVNYIAAHERFKNGSWKVTYKGSIRNLKLSDVRKTNNSTHINFSVNGMNEKYDNSVTKVRVYKKALVASMPTIEEAKNILKSNARLKRREDILKVFVYNEKSEIKIAGITTRGIYILANKGYDNWKLTAKNNINLKSVKMNPNFNGIEDVQKNGLNDVYYTTVDNKKGYNLLNVYSVINANTYTAYGKIGEAIGDFDPEVEFKFTNNTPKNLHHWFKKMIYKFGFIKKPVELTKDDPKSAVKFWIRDNGFLNKNKELQLRFRMFNGDQDRNFVMPGVHPVIAEVTVGNILYRSHYRGIVTAYDKSQNKSYVVYVSSIKRNFVSAFGYANNRVFLGTQNDGIVILDTNANTLKVLRNKQLKDKDIWKIMKKNNQYLIFTDSERAIQINARELEN